MGSVRCGSGVWGWGGYGDRMGWVGGGGGEEGVWTGEWRRGSEEFV